MAIKRHRWWWFAGPALLICSLASSSLLTDSSLTVLFIVAAVCWSAATFVWLLWRLWRWLTYRVAVRLFFSYLLLGITPFVACGLFGFVALYMFMGQYTSVQVGHEIDRFAQEMRETGRSFLVGSASEGHERALQTFAERAGKGIGPYDRLFWAARVNNTVRLPPDSPLTELPDRVFDGEVTEIVRHLDGLYFLVSVRDPSSENAVALMGLLNSKTASNYHRDQWYQVAFVNASPGNDDLNLQLTADDDGATVLVRNGDTIEETGNLWGRWAESTTGVLNKPWIVWFKLPAHGACELESGDEIEQSLLLMLLRTSPANVWRDFTASSYEIAGEIQNALIAVAVFFLIVYAVAVLISGSMILSITRATTRLTRGARAIGQGELGHRVPVRRHDQLGELASGFNRMAASVQDMLEEVKEKERLAQEMELARQIQESLLPESSQKHGPFAVHATFHPAAEVGGDAFDVFVPHDGRLQVMIADVAGHGLATGLLMASLKAMVATLLNEGYSGKDLVRRINRSLLEQQRHRTMATLSIVDVSADRNRLHLVNAGHPPPFLIDADGGMRELLAGSIPLGSRLCIPSTLECAFHPGARAVLYSDGLVEAENDKHEVFGFDRLAGLLDDHRTLETAALLALVFSEWKRWIGDKPARDDMTVVILERTHDR